MPMYRLTYQERTTVVVEVELEDEADADEYELTDEDRENAGRDTVAFELLFVEALPVKAILDV